VFAGARALFSALDDVGGEWPTGAAERHNIMLIVDGENARRHRRRAGRKRPPPQVAVAARTCPVVRYGAATCEIVTADYACRWGGPWQPTEFEFSLTGNPTFGGGAFH